MLLPVAPYVEIVLHSSAVVMICCISVVCLSVECIVTKRLITLVTHKSSEMFHLSYISMVHLTAKSEGPPRLRAQPRVGGFDFFRCAIGNGTSFLTLSSNLICNSATL